MYHRYTQFLAVTTISTSDSREIWSSSFKIHEALLKANSNNVLNLKEEMVTGSDKIMETRIDDMENLLHKIHASS